MDGLLSRLFSALTTTSKQPEHQKHATAAEQPWYADTDLNDVVLQKLFVQSLGTFLSEQAERVVAGSSSAGGKDINSSFDNATSSSKVEQSKMVSKATYASIARRYAGAQVGILCLLLTFYD